MCTSLGRLLKTKYQISVLLAACLDLNAAVNVILCG